MLSGLVGIPMYGTQKDTRAQCTILNISISKAPVAFWVTGMVLTFFTVTTRGFVARSGTGWLELRAGQVPGKLHMAKLHPHARQTRPLFTDCPWWLTRGLHRRQTTWSLELGDLKFHEQRRGPSRPLLSRARACLCPRRLCYEEPIPAAHAVVLGPEVPLGKSTTYSAWCTGRAQAGGSRLGRGSLVEHRVP